MPAEAALQAAARSLGTNAVPWFFAALSTLLVAVGLIGWSMQRYTLPRERTRWPFGAVLATRFGLGFALIIVAALVFAGIASEIGADEELARFDQALSDALGQATSDRALQAFAWVTHLGDTATRTALCLVVAVVLVVRRERALALGWVIAIAGNGILNRTLKTLFERVRPVHDHGLVLADGWSFPSGHSSGAVVAYGMLAYVLIRTTPRVWHMPVVLLATAVAFSVGCSRIFLQVHYASDVAAGFALGTAWLAVCLSSIEMARLYRGHRR